MDCIERTSYYLKGVCKDKAILEVGSKDGQKRLRTLLAEQEPKSYTGIDIYKGTNVDIECPAEDIAKRFKKESFDIIVSTVTLEHVKGWKDAIHGIKQVCKTGGLIVITIPSSYPYHKDPEDYWRYSIEDVRYIFSDFNIDMINEETVDASVYVPGSKLDGKLVTIIARKPEVFNEVDLLDYKLKPV